MTSTGSSAAAAAAAAAAALTAAQAQNAREAALTALLGRNDPRGLLIVTPLPATATAATGEATTPAGMDALRLATVETMEEAARESVEVLGVSPEQAVAEAKAQMEMMGLLVDEAVVEAVRRALAVSPSSSTTTATATATTTTTNNA